MKKIALLTIAVLMLLATSGQADLVALYHLDGNADDSSGYGNHGTVYGGASYVAGMFGQALDFDGIDGIVEVGNDPSLHVTDLTIGMWIYPHLATYDWAKTLLGYGYSPHEYFMSIGQSGGGRKIGVYIGNDGPWLWSTGEVDQGEWSHVGATFDSVNKEAKIYINGQLDITYTELGPILPTTNDLWIGNREDMPGSYVFDGLIDEVRIWDEALTELPSGLLVAIDIHPGSCPNPFSAKSKGSIPVAIVGSADLDVRTIDPASITLAGVPALAEFEIKDSTEPGDYDPADCYDCFEGEPVDTDGDGIPDFVDGYLDLVVKFDSQALAAVIGAQDRDECVPLELVGMTLSGVPIVGSDSVVIKTK